MDRSKELPHQAALRDTQHVRALDPLGVHNGLDVVDPLLEGGRLLEAIGAGHAALVELEHADVPADVLAAPAKHLVLPRELDVGDQARNDDQVRARAPALVGDVQVAATRVLDVGDVHRRGRSLMLIREGKMQEIAGARKDCCHREDGRAEIHRTASSDWLKEIDA